MGGGWLPLKVAPELVLEKQLRVSWMENRGKAMPERQYTLSNICSRMLCKRRSIQSFCGGKERPELRPVIEALHAMQENDRCFIDNGENS